MPDRTVTLLRPRAPSGYTDTAALNDIHAMLTATGTGDGALADITQILALTGRRWWPPATSRSSRPRVRSAPRRPC